MNENESKELLLRAAKDTFIKFGYSKTSMKDIAKACNRSKGLIYHYYKSKEEIFKIIVNREANSVIAEVKAHMRQFSDCEVRLKELLLFLQEVFTNQKRLHYKLFYELDEFMSQVADIFDALFSDFASILTDIIKEGQAKKVFIDSDPQLLVDTIMTVLVKYAEPKSVIEYIKSVKDEGFEHLVPIIVRGILA